MNTVPHSTPVVVTIGSKGSASEEKETRLVPSTFTGSEISLILPLIAIRTKYKS